MSESIKLFPELDTYVSSFTFEGLSGERTEVLKPLIDYITGKVAKNIEIRINFICTHNSRRSHLAQIWTQAAATYYGIPNVFCYSGGTEATALHPMAAQTLKNAGFSVQVLSGIENPVYAVKHSENEHPVIAFSKTYYDAFNPESGFAAIMTCSQADGGCPFISGAEKRIPITYEDPKAFDNTPEMADRYNERSHQIATEMFYVFSKIKK
ncbi:protein-tyrosine-phosphatase [uncultured Flavobacterium sp.]|uniref:arsenate-mycothiol transferase ArsC n=1 Tax=uncultured Flavobacterium sp. TaxID=165435 RepID=UPI0025FF8B5E|nr:protein-tyrosine-phosphatase [uncultured Flavobacterium sp.]